MKVWQSTQNSMIEISVVKILSLVVSDTATWNTYKLWIQLTVVGFGLDRLIQLLNKLYFFVILLIWSWKDTKQRRNNACVMIILNIVLFPLSLSVILCAAVLAAPLLPLFTLPVFLIGFPRPCRFWPAEVGASANVCDDTVYYQHMAPQLARAVKHGFSTGSLGKSPRPCPLFVELRR